MAALAAAWCVATLAFVVGRSAIDGLTFAGPYAGLFAGDQLRYLAWIREAGMHVLIADPFRAGAPHVYLQPLFLISGLLWRAGLSIQAAYLVWMPVAVLVLVWGYARFTGSFLAGRERAAALALGLLFFSPLVPLADYGRIVNANGANYLVIAAGHGAPYWQAWGFLPTLIALGLMPIFLLGVESLVSGDRGDRRVAGTALAGLVVAWLHPWGGIELVVIAGVLLALRRSAPGRARLAVAGLAPTLPLVYYAVLASIDPAWSLSELRSGSTGPVWPLLLAYGPLVLVALPALRRPRTAGEQILCLWPVAVLIAYVALPGSRDAALEGVSLPLAVLAVRGWRRLSVGPAMTWIVLLLAIVPGAVYSAHTFRDLFRSHDYPFALSSGEQQAVDSLAHVRGNVLATPYLASALPALAGLIDGQVKTGTNEFFDGRLGHAGVRSAVATGRVEHVISDCLPNRADLSSLLAPLGFQARSYGCARVWTFAPRAAATTARAAEWFRRSG